MSLDAALAASARDAERVLVVTPTRRDAQVTADLLARERLVCVACPDLAALAAEFAAGVGVIVMTDAALNDAAMALVLAALNAQPGWSDIPVVLLARDRDTTPAALRVLQSLTNVTLLDRPSSIRSMQSAVLTALRGRRRQYQLREQLLRQAQAEQALRESDRRKDEFLATLAHELRNPLAPIRTGLHALNRLPADSAGAARLLAMMDRQLSQLVKLIDDLLDVSRIATGKVVLRRERLDLRTVLDAALEASQPSIAAAGHRLELRTPQEPVWVLGDASRLAQVVGNLLNNAVKYTPDGGRIGLRLQQQGGDALLQVSDDGAGIPPEMLGKVFEMFTQINRTLDRAQGGLGLGLSLVRNLMDLHGGSVTVESAGLECGSTFSLRLPLCKAVADGSVGPGAAASGTSRRPLRILMVDDNVDAADSLSILLQCCGHTTRTEYAGAAVLGAVEAFRPDVVLCDIGLPGMDGYRVAEQLRARRDADKLLLVALTGWGSEEDQRRTRQAGFDVHLTKPVDLETINLVLERA